MIRMIPLCSALLLAGCNDAPDGYRFDRKEFQRPTPAITIVEHASIADLRAQAPASAKAGDDDLMAWSIIRSNSCEVHVVDPAVSYQPEWIGHETAHCVWGRWHR